MADELDIEDLGAISTLGETVGETGSTVKGLSFAPTFAASSAGVQGSSIADAISGKDSAVTDVRDLIADNMAQFAEVCDAAKNNYITTEEEISGKFKSVGGGASHGGHAGGVHVMEAV